jgi:quinol monooxygenase YgiN
MGGNSPLAYQVTAIRMAIMNVSRREFLAGVAATTGLTVTPRLVAEDGADMYGLIGKMIAVAGKRDELAAILLSGVGAMPGCLSYIVASDPADANAIWITEAWDSKASHDASLSLPQVKEAIAKGKPLIAGFGDFVVTTPVGGYGLTGVKAL